MKKSQKLLIFSLLFIPILFICTPIVSAHTEGDPFITFLYAGKPIPGDPSKIVGSVKVWNDSQYLYVKYELNGDWQLISTHLHVGTSLDDFPLAKGNPKVGKFDYPMVHDPGTQAYTAPPIPLGDWTPGTSLYIAAHGVARTITGYVSDICALLADLPHEVTFSTSYGTVSYIWITISGDGILNGTHAGWCIDTDHSIESGPYAGQVYLPYTCPNDYLFPEGLVEHPENLDLVNWIINQAFIDQPAPVSCGGGVYNFGDVQRAIWELLEDNPDAGGPIGGMWSQCRVNAILAAACANGEGFVPGCGQKVAIFLDPGTTIQKVFLEFPVPCVPCYQDETVWAGDGDDGPGVLRSFPGKNWALYFNYTVQ